MRLEAELRKQRRQQARAVKHEKKYSAYYRDGLNGARAVARRQRQYAKIEARRAL